VRDDDFFCEVALQPGADPWDMPELKVRTDLLEEVRARPLRLPQTSIRKPGQVPH
jgi:hypothetical protein